MVRTRIQLTEERTEALKAEAARQGVSMAELTRRSVDCLIEMSREPSRKELRRRAAAIAGRFRSGSGDISVRHDEYLAQTLKP